MKTKVDANAIDDSIVGNGHEDDGDQLDKELADNYTIVDRVIIKMNTIFISTVNSVRCYFISFTCFRKPDESEITSWLACLVEGDTSLVTAPHGVLESEFFVVLDISLESDEDDEALYG